MIFTEAVQYVLEGRAVRARYGGEYLYMQIHNGVLVTGVLCPEWGPNILWGLAAHLAVRDLMNTTWAITQLDQANQPVNTQTSAPNGGGQPT